MSPRTQRILCRAGFITFCLTPTLGLSGWIANERLLRGSSSPAEEALAKPLAEAELSRRLGLAVTLDRIAYPADGCTLLEGVALNDPETGRRIAFVPALEMAFRDASLVIVATRPEIDADRWQTLWELLHERVLRGRGEKIAATHVTARQVTLASQRPGRSPTFTDVEIRLAAGEAAIDFRVAGVDMPHPAHFQAKRDRAAAPPTTRWELHTGEAELPCVLFAEHLPWLAALGDRAEFHGSWWAEETAHGWRGELTGRFSHLDLDRLVSERFPHKLSGEATATFSRVEFSAGRLRHAAGWLEAGPGAISGGLLGAAVDTFGLRYTEPLPDAVLPNSRYGQLRLGFQLDEDGVRLSGNCDPEGTILVLENDPRARVLDHHPRVTPVVALVRMLVPQSEVQVSATHETRALLQVLPLPPIKRPEPPAALRPGGRVRRASSDDA